MPDIHVTVWNEFIHEKQNKVVKNIYPEGIHTAIADHLNRQPRIAATTAILEQPEHGLTLDVLSSIDVLIWWGHMAHEKVSNEVVLRVQKRVLEGMGLICLHSAHYSKIFKRLMGTTCTLNYEVAEREILWNIEPSHPISEGIGDRIELPAMEMYGERFDIPPPEKIVFLSGFDGGVVFRSGCVWERGHGRIFYFAPGHETSPVFHNESVLKIITNAVRWACPRIVRQECNRRIKRANRKE